MIFITIETMEFMRLIHAKSIGLWWGHNIHNISSKIIQVNSMIDIIWFWLVLCEIFYIYHCALTLFHDNALLFAAKVRSYSYFIYLFVLMLNLFYYLIISLVSIDLLINCHTCFTLFSKNLIIGLRRVLRLTTVPSQ